MSPMRKKSGLFSKKKKNKVNFAALSKGKMVFAFDFGEYALKIAVAKMGRGTAEIRQLISIEHEEGQEKLDANNMKLWRSRILKAFSQKNIVTNDQLAVCTVGGKSYIHRPLRLPYVPEEDRNGLIAGEMSQQLALDETAYVFQHDLLRVDESGDEKSCDVWALAMPKDTGDCIYDLIRSLKLRPVILDIHVNGLRRLFRSDEKLKAELAGQTVAVLDYGMTHTEISLHRDGLILTDTMIDSGDERLVSEAKNALGVRIVDGANPHKIVASPQEIVGILNQAQGSPEARSFSMALEDWLSKVNSVLARHQFDHPNEPVTRLYLYGGSPQNVWLVKYLSGVTGLPASLLPPSPRCEMSPQSNLKNVNVSAYLNVLNLFLME